MEELLGAFNIMKNEKASGPDNIPVEFFKYVESEKFMAALLLMINGYFAEGILDNAFKDVIVSFLHKKGDKTDCNNYRTLSLGSHIGKVIQGWY